MKKILMGMAVIGLVSVGTACNSSKPHNFGSEYHAVTLTNNTLYFGKIQQLDGDFVRLHDLYQLMRNTSGEGAPQPGVQLSLVRPPVSYHGPAHEMILNRQHVLYVRPLREDSKVREAMVKQADQPIVKESTAEESAS